MVISIKNKRKEYLTPKVKIFPSDVVNKITAGEVVERSASIVKEVIEYE